MAFGGLKGTLTGSAASILASNDITNAGISVAVGDLVFVLCAQQSNLTSSGCSDNLGNTYVAVNAGTDGGNTTARAWYSRVTVAGTLTTITLTATASTLDFAGVAAVIEGPFVVNPLDANPANISADTTTPFTCPATGTLTQTAEVVMCGVAYDAGTLTATAPNLTAATFPATGNVKAIVGYQTVAATTSVAPAFTLSSGTIASDVLITASFKQDLSPTRDLTPGLITNAQTFYAPTVAPGAVNLSPDLVTNSQTFYAPTIATGGATQALTPGLVTNSQSFGAPTVGRGAVDLTSGLFTNAQSFFAPAVGRGAVALTPAIFTNGQTFFAPSVAAIAAGALLPGLFSPGQTFFAPSIGRGAVGLFPSLVSALPTFFAPAIGEPAAQNLAPTLFVNTQRFFPPTVRDMSTPLHYGGTRFFEPLPPRQKNVDLPGARIILRLSIIPGAITEGIPGMTQEELLIALEAA